MNHENAYGPTGAPTRWGMGWTVRLLLAFGWGLTSAMAVAQCPTEIEVLEPISCSGADDAVLTVSVPDGVDPEDVYWLFETDTLFGAVQSGLGPGSYLAFVPGCGALGINVNEPFPFFITTTLDQLPTCDDPCSGVVTATPNFGQAPFTFSWSHDAAQTGGTGTGICEQTVVVTATDANGCSDDDIVTVEIPDLEVLAFATDPSCNGFDDGTVSAVASGGLGGAYTFDWTDAMGNAVGSGADLTGLLAGTYTVTATDAGGCTMTASVTLTDPPAVEVEVSTTPVSCVGDEDGTASALVDGATLYAWTGPDGFANAGPGLTLIEGLVPGTYTVFVTAADGCVGEGSAVLTEPEALSSEPFSAPPACPGESTGTVGVVPTGGTAPYEVNWTLPDGGMAMGEFLNDVSAGSYAYTLEDANGCSDSGTVELVDPVPLSVSVVATAPSCAEGAGSANGMLEATVTGGVEPYLSSWVNATTMEVVAAGLVATDLMAGTYGFGVVDVAGCTLDTVLVLEAPDALDLAVTALAPSCFAELDGSAEAVVEGGTPGYTVSWSGDVALTLGTSIANLGAGAYDVVAEDANGCTADTAFVLTEPEALEVALSASPVGCSGNDGDVMAEVTGGTPEWTVSWTGPSGDAGTGLTLSGLEVGTYSADVEDAQGCTANESIEVVALPELVLTADVSVADCATGQGALTWMAEGGEAPLTPILTDVDAGVVDPASWSSLAPGTYTLSVTDNRGCSVDSTLTLDPPLVLGTAVQPAGCGGLGALEGTISGGTGMYSWTLSPDLPTTTLDSLTATWTELPAGDYTVTVDDGTCTTSSSETVEGVDVFDWTITALGFACVESPGAISVVLNGGVEPVVFSGSAVDGDLSWSTADTLGLTPGSYAIGVTDGAGCQRDTVVAIGALPALTVMADATPISCAGAMDGAIDLTAVGGTEPHLLGAQGPNGFVAAPLVDLMAGTYVAGVVDDRGCVADTTVVIVEPMSIGVSTQVTAESCPGTADGQAWVMASGGTGTLMVQWTDGPQDSLWTGLSAGSYTWTVTDSAGCDTTGVVAVETGLGPVVLDTVVAGPCVSGVPSADVQLIVNGTADLVEALLGGLPADVVTPNDTGATWTWVDLAEGTYGWTVSLGGACGTNGTVDVDLANPLEWIGTVTPPVCEGDSGQVVGITAGGEGLIQTAWTGVSTLGDSLSGASLSTGPIPSGTYTFMAMDDAGCSVDTTVVLTPQSAGLTVSMDILQPSCGGAIAGEATLIPSGGLAPYSVVVEGAADSLFLPFLLPGTYPVLLTDSVGCTWADSVVVDPASSFTLTADVDSASCANSEDGSIVMVPVDATGDVQFTFVGPFGATPVGDTIADVGAGVYEITGLDEAGCPAVLLVSVGAPEPLVVSLDSLDRPSCVDDADGALAITASGGTGDPADWVADWSLDGVTFAQGTAIEGLAQGDYAVTVTDDAGCTGSIASIPLVAEGDVVLFSPSDTVLCSGVPLGLEGEATGASTTSWSVADSVFGPGLSAAVEFVSEGPTLWVFTAARLGCVRSDTVEVVGLSLPAPDAGPDQVVPQGSPGAVGTAPNSDWTYSWSPAEDVLDPALSATATQPLQTTTAFILTATTGEGCSVTDTVVVEVLQELDIPSGFTPNDDGVNDRWNLGGLDQYPSAEITVFNRWGDILFTQGATEGPWDGTLDGIPVPVGTYYYHIRVSEPALEAEWTGPITLMR